MGPDDINGVLTPTRSVYILSATIPPFNLPPRSPAMDTAPATALAYGKLRDMFTLR